MRICIYNATIKTKAHSEGVSVHPETGLNSVYSRVLRPDKLEPMQEISHSAPAILIPCCQNISATATTVHSSVS
jgi:hypothetical protein